MTNLHAQINEIEFRQKIWMRLKLINLNPEEISKLLREDFSGVLYIDSDGHEFNRVDLEILLLSYHDFYHGWYSCKEYIKNSL